VRYADDFIVTGSSRELLETEVKPLVERFLHKRGLVLSQEKTTITHIEDGFDFLGQNIRKYHGKILTKPSQRAVKDLLAHVREIVKKQAGASAGALIQQLNPVIRGLAAYHQHVVSKRIFGDVDSAIYQILWQWVRRRHHSKPLRWIKDKYFHNHDGRNWVFTGELKQTGQPSLSVRLFRASSVPIKRHVKIQGKANPFSLDWEIYFERRLDVQMEQNLAGKRRLLELWTRQQGLCPVCHQKITKLTGWHSHHVVWRSRGGSDAQGNRQLMHPNCHMQLHHGAPL
jgi:RNA-directed DNA polymerase